MELEGVIFRNFQNPSLNSLIKMELGAFDLVFNNIKFDVLYLEFGLISCINPFNTNATG